MKPDALSALPNLGLEYSSDVAYLIELVIVSSFPERWPESEVAAARARLQAQYGRVPSLEALAERFGEHTVLEVGDTVLAKRDAQLADATERLGLNSACHLCQAMRSDGDPYYNFGLARSVQSKTEWGGWLATMAANVVTVPLGVAVGALPGSRTTARIVRLRLALCSACAKRRRSLFGGLKVSAADCSRHPSWERIRAAGFTVWLDREQLANYKRVDTR